MAARGGDMWPGGDTVNHLIFDRDASFRRGLQPFRPSARIGRKSGAKRIVLLQGPVGPFFRELKDALDQARCDVWRISFSAGDRLFARRDKLIRFRGDLSDWECWFADFCDVAEIDSLVLFGAERPVHRVARKVAEAKDVEVVSLEEGYIRSGFISVEDRGNNAASPLAGRLPPPGFVPDPSCAERGGEFRALGRKSLYGLAYYAAQTLLTFGASRQLFHRPMRALPEIFCWVRNGWRRLVDQSRNFIKIQQLLEHCDGRYFIVPLQVEADMQMKGAALGWTHPKLISALLKSFARHAPPDCRLVFKVHPLERGHHSHGALIADTAEAYGIRDQVDVIDTGSMGLMTRHAAGMITINSTSGFSAIHHGVPLLVVGAALYAHPELATCAMGAPDFDSFWSKRYVASAEVRRNYLAWIREEALVPGDFYDPEGVQTACRGILGKLAGDRQQQQEDESQELRTAC